MDKVTETEEVVEKTTTPAATPRFGDDDLGRLQSILLGDHAASTSTRIDTLEKALLGAIADLRSDLDNRLEAIESRITAEADTRSKGLGNLASRVDEESSDRQAAVEGLTGDLRASESNLHSAIDAVSDAVEGHVEELRAATRELGQTSTDLGGSKVDRDALADLLASAAEGLRQPND